MLVKDKIREYLDYKGISPTATERRLGWGVGAFTKAKSITSDRCCEFLSVFTDLSAEWLMRGKGTMILGQTQPDEIERMNKLVDTIATLQSIISDKNATIRILEDKIARLTRNQ